MPDLTSLPLYIHDLAALGDRTALIEQRLVRSRTYSYAELIARSHAFAGCLRQRGLVAGDRVMIWGAAGAAWAIAFYGCVLARRVRDHTSARLLCSDGADPGWPQTDWLAFAAIVHLPPAPAPPAPPPPAPDTLIEIVYTSGTTADPKGVMITHGNLLANLQPVAREIDRYKRLARPFLPLRFLHLIPLSHLFGQVLGLLIPPLVDSAVIYSESQSPAQWAEIVRRRRASVIVAVPRQLELLSQWALQQTGQSLPAAVKAARGRGVAWRWWHWRRLHHRLGWKMWALIVGGASLDPNHEALWGAFGFAILQGYGLTETAPAIAITHPFRAQRGAVGRKLAGLDLRLATDGEILVRGANVSPGYYRDPAATTTTFADGWLHTGDLGRLDTQGNLHFLGRKKEVIVTADGLNVYPADVEAALTAQPGIQEAAVLAAHGGVHAVAIVRPGGDLDDAVAAANHSLEAHQRIRSANVWPGTALPRTASTGKLRRAAIATWVNDQSTAPASSLPGWREFLRRRWDIAPERLRPETELDRDLGLSSLDRVELLSWLESHVAAAISEETLGAVRTVADLDALTAGGPPAAVMATSPAPIPLPRSHAFSDWPLRSAACGLRSAARPLLMFPALAAVVRGFTVEGAEELGRLRRPVLFIANHQSLLDVPLILRALPRSWRPWLAPGVYVNKVGEGGKGGVGPRF